MKRLKFIIILLLFLNTNLIFPQYFSIGPEVRYEALDTIALLPVKIESESLKIIISENKCFVYYKNKLVKKIKKEGGYIRDYKVIKMEPFLFLILKEDNGVGADDKILRTYMFKYFKNKLLFQKEFILFSGHRWTLGYMEHFYGNIYIERKDSGDYILEYKKLWLPSGDFNIDEQDSYEMFGIGITKYIINSKDLNLVKKEDIIYAIAPTSIYLQDPKIRKSADKKFKELFEDIILTFIDYIDESDLKDNLERKETNKMMKSIAIRVLRSIYKRRKQSIKW